MNPIIIAAGLYLSARIVSFIAGELTESEISKQKEIGDAIDRIQSHYQETAPSGSDDEVIQKKEKDRGTWKTK